jgi:uncharacterized membrane protein
MNGKYITLRIVSALVLVAVLAGIAFFAYQAALPRDRPSPSKRLRARPYPRHIHIMDTGCAITIHSCGASGV